MTALISIGSSGTYVDLPMPKEGGYSTTLNDLGKYNRNTKGNLFAYRVNQKFTIEAEWSFLTPEEKSLIASLTSGIRFQVRFFDTFTSTYKYGEFYRGNDFQVAPQIRYDHMKGDFMYYNVKISMVEY